MGLVTRAGKESKLTIAEMDGNLTYLQELAETGGNIIQTSYFDLKAIVTLSKLVPGQQYQITDFATAYNIFDGGDFTIIEEQVGTNEPIIVTAISTTEIDKVAISTTYPKDILHYSLDLVDDTDIGFGDGSGTPTDNFKGQIYYREDIIQNNICRYDFRNVKFRRWAVDAVSHTTLTYASFTGDIGLMVGAVTLNADFAGTIGNSIFMDAKGATFGDMIDDWNLANTKNTVTFDDSPWAGEPSTIAIILAETPSSGITLSGGTFTTYTAKDVIKSVTDGKIYKCIVPLEKKDPTHDAVPLEKKDPTHDAAGTDPSADTTNWVLWLDIVTDAYVSWTKDITKFDTGDITTTNLIFVAGTYQDLYTFGVYYAGCRDNNIGGINIALMKYSTSLNNIVLKSELANDTSVIGSIIHTNSFCNTVGVGFGFNTTLQLFAYNVIGLAFGNNKIDDYFFKNVIHDDTERNSFGLNFNKNVVLDNFKFQNILAGVNQTDFALSTHVYGEYNTTIYNDKTNGLKLSYMDNNNMKTADVTD